jgi:shikimate kinase
MAATPIFVPGSNIAFVGLMGAGKTTLGKLLSQRWGYEFLDSDAEIVKATGVEIATIFEIEGEDAFRDREAQTIALLLEQARIVLSTGGGAILRAATREALRTKTQAVYLHASAQTVYERIKHHRGRPLLATADPLAKLEQLYTERDPLYREVAQVIVEVGSDPPSSVARKIEHALATGASKAGSG